MRYSYGISLFLLIFGATAYGETVEEATTRYFQVTKSGDYLAAANLFDPEEIRSFRESLNFLVSLPDAQRENLYGSLFGPGSTQEIVAQLSDTEYFASFFGVAMTEAGMTEIMRSAKTEYLGHVMEGEDTAHAVTRITIQTGGAEIKTLSVASFIKCEEIWKMKMTGDIQGVAAKIRTAVGM